MDEQQDAVPSWRVRVSGRVLGVYFRAWTQQQARSLGICGWVRNEDDGGVTALLQHSDERVLAQMLELLRAGPPAAAVLGLDCEVLGAYGELHSGFSISR